MHENPSLHGIGLKCQDVVSIGRRRYLSVTLVARCPKYQLTVEAIGHCDEVTEILTLCLNNSCQMSGYVKEEDME
jgi:hypothetical protein